MSSPESRAEVGNQPTGRSEERTNERKQRFVTFQTVVVRLPFHNSSTEKLSSTREDLKINIYLPETCTRQLVMVFLFASSSVSVLVSLHSVDQDQVKKVEFLFV